MFVSTVFTISLLCLAFNTTRLIGVIALTLLSLVYPVLLIVLLVLGGVILFFIRSYP
ncbi:MAG TPA: hypothetical protein VIJ25_09865 [Methylococcales bacterium]